MINDKPMILTISVSDDTYKVILIGTSDLHCDEIAGYQLTSCFNKECAVHTGGIHIGAGSIDVLSDDSAFNDSLYSPALS